MTPDQNPELSAPRLNGGLPALVLLLRQAGFKVGPSEAIDAARLIKSTQRDDKRLDPRAVQIQLKSIFCKSQQELAAFDDLYSQWCKSLQQDKQQNAQQTSVDDGQEQDQGTPEVDDDPGTHTVKLIATIAMVVVFGILLANNMWNKQPDEKLPKATPQPSGEQTAKPVITKTPERSSAVVSKRDNNFYPVYRQQQAIRPLWAWILLGLVAAPILLLFAPAMRITSSSRFSNQRIPISGWPSSKTARHVTQAMGAGTRLRLGRHRSIEVGSVQDTGGLRRAHIDVYQTVVQTIKRHGVPTIVRHPAKIRPSYLILVCADSEDHYLVHWADKFRSKTLDATVAFFVPPEDAKPPVLRIVSSHTRSASHTVAINRLPDPEPGQRLVVVGDASIFVEANRRLKIWVHQARLDRWRERVWFTTKEPRDWGDDEEALEKPLAANDPGFLVMPLDDNSLVAWSHLLTRDVLPVFYLSRPQRFPRLLCNDTASRFLEESPPDADIPELIRQLKLYLDENGYFWLCCCAVVPVIDARLTLLLGESLFLRGGAVEARLPVHIASCYPRLVLLPWIQKKIMPAWLRLALLASVPAAIQDEVRDNVLSLLEQQRCREQADFYVGGDKDPATQQVHNLFVGFLDGRTPESLSMEVPLKWRNWVKKLVPHRPLWRRVIQHLTAVIDGAASPRGAFGIGRSQFWIAFAAVVLAMAALLTTWLVPSNLWPANIQALFTKTVSKTVTIDHGDGPITAHMSSDGSRLLTAGESGFTKIWDTATGQVIRSFGHRRKEINMAALSGDGQWVATAGQQLELWNVDSGEQIDQFDYILPVQGVSFSSNSDFVLVWGNDEDAYALAVQKGDGNAILRHDAVVTDAFFSEDDTIAITIGNDDTARVFSLPSTLSNTGTITQNSDPMVTTQPRELARLQHDSTILGAGISIDQSRVLTWTANKSVHVWDIDSAEIIWQWLDKDGISGAHFAASSDKVVIWNIDGKTAVWDITTNRQPTQYWDQQSIKRVLSSNQAGSRLLVESVEGTVQVHDSSGQIVTTLPGHPPELQGAAFYSNDRNIFTASMDGSIQLWDASPVTEEETRPFDGKVADVLYQKTNALVATVVNDTEVHIWDATTGENLVQLSGHSSAVRKARFSPDRLKIAIVHEDYLTQVWNTKSGNLIYNLTPFDLQALNVEFSSDSKRIITTSANALSIFNSKNGKPISGIENLSGARISQQGDLVASANEPGVQIINANDSKPIAAINLVDGNVLDMAFSPNGLHIAIATRNSAIYSTRTGALVATMGTLNDFIYQVTYSTAGNFLVTSGPSKAIRASFSPPAIWNARTGEPIATLDNVIDPVTGVAFSSDESRIAVTTNNGVTQVFDSSTGAPLSPAIRNDGETIFTVFNPDDTSLLVAGIATDQNLQSGGSHYLLQDETSNFPLENEQNQQNTRPVTRRDQAITEKKRLDAQSNTTTEIKKNVIPAEVQKRPPNPPIMVADPAFYATASFVTIRQTPPPLPQRSMMSAVWTQIGGDSLNKLLSKRYLLLAAVLAGACVIAAFSARRRQTKLRKFILSSFTDETVPSP